jgi:hypothetical protein
METINFYSLEKTQKYLDKSKDEQLQFTGMAICRHILICGATGPGKTNALMNYIYLTSQPKKGTFSHIFLVYKTDEALYKMLKDDLKDKITLVKNLTDINVDKFPDQTKYKYLIIFDDQINETSKQALTTIINFFTYGRKKGITLLFLSQSFFDTATFIRKQVGYVILTGIKGNRDLNLLLKDNSIADVDSKQIAKIYQTATEKRTSNDMPFFKIDTSCCPINKRFSRNFLDYIPVENKHIIKGNGLDYNDGSDSDEDNVSNQAKTKSTKTKSTKTKSTKSKQFIHLY